MNIPTRPAAPASGTPSDDVPTYEQLLADPEIAALVEFEPVPRRFKKPGGWTAEKQRMFIARLARHGSPGKACDEMGMYRSGIDKVFKSPGSESFRDAWAAAVALAERREVEGVAAGQASVAALKMPFLDNRRRTGGGGAAAGADEPLPGQVRNELDEWEDEDSLVRRGAEANDSTCAKLLRLRRGYLQDICLDPGKRAAFEILTELPIDWDKAQRLEPQPDEPWNPANQHQPDMVLTAESGWTYGEFGYGPDRKAEARREIDEWRKAEGLPPIEWPA